MSGAGFGFPCEVGRLAVRQNKTENTESGDETMTRTILLTAAVAALTVALAPTNASADELASSNGRISADQLAALGLGGSDVVTDDEGEEIRGKGGRNSNLKNRYRAAIQDLNRQGKLRRIQRKIVKKNTVRLTRLKNASRVVKYRAPIKNTKRTVSRSGGYSGASRFRF